jgi:long-chain fatty acid transport protein
MRAVRCKGAVAFLICGSIGSQAVGGAFQLNERSPIALGTSLSGSVSAASDVTFAAFNPAALTVVETFAIGGNFSVVAPVSDGTIQSGPFAGQTFDADRTGLVPSVSTGYRLTRRIVVGFTTYTPFGLKTGYPDDSPVAPDALESELITLSLSPTVSYDLLDNVTVGASANLLYVDATLDNAAVDLEGDKFGFSFSVGVLAEPVPGTRIGAAYHHGYDLEIGTRSFGGFPGDVAASLPNWLQIGLTQSVTDDLRLMAEGRWVNWSKFDSVDITTPALSGTALGEVSEVQNYEDTLFFGVGAEYDVTERFTVRGGFAYDQTPTTNASRTARVPDEDRLWISMGGSYDLTDSISIDAGYSYLYALEDPVVKLRNGAAAGTKVIYDAAAHIISIGGSFRF